VTEQIQEQTPYERLRSDEAIPRDIREQWLSTDTAAGTLTRNYRRILEDGELTPEAKVARAQTLYQEQAPRVVEKKKRLRADLIKAAEGEEHSAIPFVRGASLNATNSNDVIAAQNEADRIVRQLERRADNSPFGATRHSDFLQDEYKRGLEIGGAEGSALCRGALRAAHELGLGTGAEAEWLPREAKHHEHLDRARRLRYASDSISSEAPKPPKALRRSGARRIGSERGPEPMLMGGGGNPLQPKRAKRSWK